jgi:hypothetical protein
MSSEPHLPPHASEQVAQGEKSQHVRRAGVAVHASGIQEQAQAASGTQEQAQDQVSTQKPEPTSYTAPTSLPQ